MLNKLQKSDFNRTKIVATIGPATESKEMLIEIIKAGVDICRLNFSHGKHDDLERVIGYIREINQEYNTHISILCDLQGPKIRIGELAEGSRIWETGDKVVFTNDIIETTDPRFYISYPDFARDVQPGEWILVNDGAFLLKAISSDGQKEVVAEVLQGGIITSRKGVNLPDTKISLPSLTEKDREDLEFALKHNVDWIALSFVRSAKDVIELREIIKAHGRKCKIISKIEKPEAVLVIDEIIAVSDAVMVARGDLGVEMALEDVPMLQKTIVRKCKAASKPVVIATQMMESMIHNPRPTRAEANDVANAVMDGADAVMLSAETSVGKYPIQVIECMDKIIERIETDKSVYSLKVSLNKQSASFISDAVCLNAVQMSKEVGAKAIISMTKSGYTAFKIASFRPEAKIYIFSDDLDLLSTINLIWGVKGFYYNKFESTDNTIQDVIDILKESEHVQVGDVVINTASMPIETRGRTNALKISVIE